MNADQRASDTRSLETELRELRKVLKVEERNLARVNDQLDRAPENRILVQERKRLTDLIQQQKGRLVRIERDLTALRSRTESIVLDLTSDEEPIVTAAPPAKPRAQAFVVVEPPTKAEIARAETELARTESRQDDERNTMKVDVPLAATIAVSEIQRRVAEHELRLAAGEGSEQDLYSDTPTLLQPALLDSLWAESGRAALAESIGAVSVSAATAGARADVDTADVRGGYDAHIALIHEYTSPLLNDASTSYEQGDAWELGDTFYFPRSRPRFDDEEADDEEEEGRDETERARKRIVRSIRDFQHRFVFSPNRYDIALSWQAIAGAGTPLAELSASSIRLRTADRDRQFQGKDVKELYQRLLRAVDNNSLMLPGIYTELDARQAAEQVSAPRSVVPLTRLEVTEMARTFSERVNVSRYRRLESRSNFSLSRRVVTEASTRTQFRGGDGAHTRNESFFPEELLVGAKTFDDIDDERTTETIAEQLAVAAAPASEETIDQARIEAQRLLAMVDIEQALAEFDGTEYGMLRTQSVDTKKYGPFYVVDDVREYDLAEPVESLVKSLGGTELSDEFLETRLQRHSVKRLVPRQLTPLTYARLRRVQGAPDEQITADEEEEIEEDLQALTAEADSLVQRAVTSDEKDRAAERRRALDELRAKHRRDANQSSTVKDENKQLEFPPDAAKERKSKRQRDDDDVGSGESNTVEVLQNIEDELAIRAESRQKRKKRVAVRTATIVPVDEVESRPRGTLPVGGGQGLGASVRPTDVGRDQPAGASGFATLRTTAHAILQSHLALVHSAVKTKEENAVGDEEENSADDDDDAEIKALRKQFAKERREEAEQEKTAEDIEEDEEDELLEEFDDQLALGATVVRSSPALFERSRANGYFGPVIGVPASASQLRLLTALKNKGWRAAARVILLTAIYYKLVPRLYTESFPREAVQWLIAALRLVRARVDVAVELYNNNVTSAYAKLRRLINEDEVGVDDDSREELLAAAGINTAVLPPVLVIDTDSTIGQFAESGGEAEGFSPLDVSTTALIYATHALRPRNARDLIGAAEFDRSAGAEDQGLAAESYPLFDTYGRTPKLLGNMLAVVGNERAAAITNQYRATLNETLGDAVDLYADELRSITAGDATSYEVAVALSRAVFPRLERGEHNDVAFVYLPLPTIDIAAIERAGTMYTTMHSTNGVLDTANVVNLASARVRDRRELSERVLLAQCAAPTYVAAAQHYVSENFPPRSTGFDLALGKREPARTPFAVYRNDAISVADSLRSLLSSDWLGGGRVFADTLQTDPATATVGNERVPFYKVLAPRTVSEWCRVVAKAIDTAAVAAGGTVDLTQGEISDALSTANKSIDKILTSVSRAESDIALDAFYEQYNAALSKLTANLKEADVKISARELPTTETLSALLDVASGLLRNRQEILYINRRQLAPSQRTTIPFPGLNCDQDTTFLVSSDDRRALAELWYNASQRLDFFPLGYLNVPFNNSLPTELAPASDGLARYGTFAHIYRQLDEMPEARFAELKFLMAREVGIVQQGRTLWFEEALIHSDPVGFGDLVRVELKTLVQWLKGRKQIAMSDYTGALGTLTVVNENSVVVDASTVIEQEDDNLRTLDPRNARLIDDVRRAVSEQPRTKKKRGDEEGLELTTTGPRVPVDLPYGNHKKLTLDNLELAQLLYNETSRKDAFPLRKYKSTAARRDAITALADYTRRALNEVNFDVVEERVANPQSDVTIPEEWLFDVGTTRSGMQAVNQQERERATISTGEAEQSRAAELRKLRSALAKAKLPALAAANAPTAADLQTIDNLLADTRARRERILNAFTDLVRDFVAGTVAIDSDAVPVFVDRLFGSAAAQSDEEAAVRAALLRLLAQIVRRQTPSDDEDRAPFETASEAINFVNAAFQAKNGGVYLENLVVRLRPVKRALEDYRTTLEAIAAARDEMAEEREAPQLADPADLRAVLTLLLDFYQTELDRLQLEQVVSAAAGDKQITLDREAGPIGAFFIALLMPAAIERARIQLMARAAERAGDYKLAYRGDVPQALRVAELVRDYCVAGRVPLPPAESSVFNEYNTLLQRAVNGREPWTIATVQTPLINTDNVLTRQRLAPAVADTNTYTPQLYTMGNGLHHQLPFGADLQLSAFWLRLMRLYLQYNRWREQAEGQAGSRAFSSLRLLYLSSQGLPYRRELTRMIAELPRATDRCQLYLVLFFARYDDKLLDVVPTALRRTLGAQWRDRATTPFLPLIEEMRPIDARLLVSLITGFDYSPLRRRERRDQFNPERFDVGTEEGVVSDDEEDDADVEDDGDVRTDGREATQRLDTEYIYRRAVATKEALVDAYLRIVIEQMFAVTPADLAAVINTARAAGTPLTDPKPSDVEIVYQVVRARAGETAPPIEQQYSAFIAADRFEQRADTSGTPVRRLATLASVVAKRLADGDKALITRLKMLSIYRTMVRDWRLEVRRTDVSVLQTKVPVTLRRLAFEPVGSVHMESTGAQVHEFARGRGFAAAERSLLSALVRNRYYEREATNAKAPISAALRTHREPAWHLVPRAALIGAMQVLSIGQQTRQAILLAVLETVSKKLDLAQHLWHDDTAIEPTVQERTSFAQQRVVLPPTPVALPPPLAAEELALEQAVVALRDEPIVVAEPATQRAPVSGLVEIEAADNTDSDGWRRLVERNIGRLLLGPSASSERVSSFVGLALSIDAPSIKSQQLLRYEAQQLIAVTDEDEYLRAFLFNVIQPVTEALRWFFTYYLDVGGTSESFSEAALLAQQDQILAFEADVEESDLSIVLEKLETVPQRTLFWLLARTEARRRARWRALSRRRDTITEAEISRIRSLTLDDESATTTTTNVDDDNDEPVAARGSIRYYGHWSALFYNALDEALRRQTSTVATPKRIIEDFVKSEEQQQADARDGQAPAAQAYLARLAARSGKAITTRLELERYVPVYALLMQLFFRFNKTKGFEIVMTNQYHPLLALLIAPFVNRDIVRLHSVPDTTTKERFTITTLASPVYPRTATFEPNEMRVRAASTPFTNANVWLVHEFVPLSTQPQTKINYTIINRVVRGDARDKPAFEEADFNYDFPGAPPTLEQLLTRIATTLLDQPSRPMLRIQKAPVVSKKKKRDEEEE